MCCGSLDDGETESNGIEVWGTWVGSQSTQGVGLQLRLRIVMW